MNDTLLPIDSGAPSGELTLLVFELAGARYAFPFGCVCEVLRDCELTPVPGAPAHVLGVIAAAGCVVTVFELGAAAAPTARARDGRPRVVLLRTGGETVGLRVDAVHGVRRLDAVQVRSLCPSEAEAVVPDLLGACLVGRAQSDPSEPALWLLDASRLPV